jgi:hypothetical protein
MLLIIGLLFDLVGFLIISYVNLRKFTGDQYLPSTWEFDHVYTDEFTEWEHVNRKWIGMASVIVVIGILIMLSVAINNYIQLDVNIICQRIASAIIETT